jgi:lysophospholipase L1-like esterase
MRFCPRGFRDEDWGKTGARRILCLGDSCTFGRATSYPRELERIFDDERPGSVDVLNAGIPGYSSFQARLLLDGPLREDLFDLLVLYVGFNDGRPSPIPDAARPRVTAFAGTLRTVLGNLRLYQGLRRLRVSLASPATDAGASAVRVSLEEYRANLRALLDQARSRGARTLLLTTPSLFTPESDGGREVAARNEVVRAVATSSGVPFVDIDRRFRETGNRGLFDGSAEPIPGTRVGADLIHPNELGLRLIAEQVREAIGQHGLLQGIGPAVQEEPAKGSFALACGDVDVDGSEEIAASTVRGERVVVALLDASGQRRWVRQLEGAPHEEPVFLAASREGDTFYVLDRGTVAEIRGHGSFIHSIGRIAEFRAGSAVRVGRTSKPWETEESPITGFATLEIEGGTHGGFVIASDSGEACSVAVLTQAFETRAEFPLRVPPFAVEKNWRRWTLAPSPPPLGAARFLAAPIGPAPGWIGFASFSGDGAMVDACMAFGFGGFEAGLRLASSPFSPRVYAARGPCVRVFDRVGTGTLPWLPVDALFPFGFSSDSFHGSSCATAVLPAPGEAGIVVVTVEGRRQIVELDARGEVRRKITWP